MAYDTVAARHLAGTFVTHATVLLAVNLMHEIDPALSGLIAPEAPDADALVDDQTLIDQVIRAPRGEPRLERALHWFDHTWFALTEEEAKAVKALALQELARRRLAPAIFELDDAMEEAAALLEQLIRQSADVRDVSLLVCVLEKVRAWQIDPAHCMLPPILTACDAAKSEPEGLPSSEVVRRIRLLAHEGSLMADAYLSLHFDPIVLEEWDKTELTALVRTRYPLMRQTDVESMVRALVRKARQAAAKKLRDAAKRAHVA
jgi:hypothetical protein